VKKAIFENWAQLQCWGHLLEYCMWIWCNIKLVCLSHQRWGTFIPNLEMLGLLVLELFNMYVTDGRTDKSKAYCPLPCEQGHNDNNINSNNNFKNTMIIIIITIHPRVFLFFFIRGGTCSLHMPVMRPASQAGPMRNPRKGTSVVLHDTIKLTWWCV